MKPFMWVFFAALMLPMAACERQEGPAEEVGEGVDDAMNQRPMEGAQDTMEDAGEAMDDAVNDTQP